MRSLHFGIINASDESVCVRLSDAQTNNHTTIKVEKSVLHTHAENYTRGLSVFVKKGRWFVGGARVWRGCNVCLIGIGRVPRAAAQLTHTQINEVRGMGAANKESVRLNVVDPRIEKDVNYADVKRGMELCMRCASGQLQSIVCWQCEFILHLPSDGTNK